MCREQTDVVSPCNYVLRDLCEVVLQRRRNEKASACSTSFCGLHREKFNLFCLEDEQLLCGACRASKTHENHKCCTIDSAARDRKVRQVKAITDMYIYILLFFFFFTFIAITFMLLKSKRSVIFFKGCVQS